jgi:hypothetical protein
MVRFGCGKTERWRPPDAAAGRRCVSGLSRRGRISGAQLSTQLLTHLISFQMLRHQPRLPITPRGLLYFDPMRRYLQPAYVLWFLNRGIPPASPRRSRKAPRLCPPLYHVPKRLPSSQSGAETWLQVAKSVPLRPMAICSTGIPLSGGSLNRR